MPYLTSGIVCESSDHPFSPGIDHLQFHRSNHSSACFRTPSLLTIGDFCVGLVANCAGLCLFAIATFTFIQDAIVTEYSTLKQ